MSADAVEYPGRRFGLPVEGVGSIATWGRRIAALLIDFLACGVLARPAATLLGIENPDLLWVAATIVLFVETTVLVGLLGTSLGHRLMGVRVARVDRRPVGLPAAALRTLLLCLLFPALVADKDRRGLHDLAAGTVVVRV